MSAAAPVAATEGMLERWFAAVNAQDVEALVALCHPSVEIVPVEDAVSTAPGTRYHGHDGLRSLMIATFDTFPQLKVSPGQPQTVGDWMLVPIVFDLNDGVTSRTRPAVSVFRTEQGTIRRILAFDTEAEARHFVEGRGAGLLTAREREVLGLLAEGLHADEVADRLVISPLTVRTHVRNAKDKLGARTSGHAIAMAIREQAGP